MSQLNPCPCCGYLTFEKPAPGTYQICPVCFWEDAKSFSEWGQNEVDLIQAQRNFIEMGACEEKWLNSVRCPTPNSQKSSNWTTLDENFTVFKQKVIHNIHQAFNGVELEDGTTLLEARLIDDYEFRYSQKKKDKNERLEQQKQHNRLFLNRLPELSEDFLETTLIKNWQDIPDKLIEFLFDVLGFLDKKGYRFYLPAYMIWTINYYDTSNSSAIGSTIYSLIPSDFSLSQQELLNEEQSQAVCQFLRFMSIYDYNFDIEQAMEYWQKFCSPLGNEVYYLS